MVNAVHYCVDIHIGTGYSYMVNVVHCCVGIHMCMHI